MPLTIRVRDEVIPGANRPLPAVTLPEAQTTAREIIRNRIREEVERHNQTLPEVFLGLVQPEESERILNGEFRMRVRRPLDWQAQFNRACSSFEQNGFLLLVDGRQVTDLDERIELGAGSEAQFIKLVPLIGG